MHIPSTTLLFKHALVSIEVCYPIVVYFCMLQDTYMHKMVASGNQFDIVSLASVAK
jgi:hypothetical protein